MLNEFEFRWITTCNLSDNGNDTGDAGGHDGDGDGDGVDGREN